MLALPTKLSSDKGQGLALDLYPDLFRSCGVRMGLAESHGIECHGYGLPQCHQSAGAGENVFHTLDRMAGCASARGQINVSHEQVRAGRESAESGH